MAKIGVLCVLLIMIFSCDTQDKQTKLSLKYEHNQRSSRQVETPVRHNIKVEPNIAEAWLDSNMSATVEVPVDTSMHVDYKNSLQNIRIYIMNMDLPTLFMSQIIAQIPSLLLLLFLSTLIILCKRLKRLIMKQLKCTENCTVDK